MLKTAPAPPSVEHGNDEPRAPADPAPAAVPGDPAAATDEAVKRIARRERFGGGEEPLSDKLALGVIVLALVAAGLQILRRRGDVFSAISSAAATLGASPGGRVRRAVKAMAWVAVSLVTSALLVQVGKLALYRPALAVVVACAILACVLFATDPLALATVAVLGVWVIERVSAGGIDISGSDTLLAIGAIGALPFVPWQNPNVRRVITAVVVFEAVLFVTVLAHPSARGLFEWAHRLFLTGGGVVVGAALAHHGRSRATLRAFLVVCTVVGAAAVVASAAGGFAPAQVLNYHKNFIGSMMVFSLAVSYLAAGHTGWSSAQLFVVKAASAAGLLASQSRGAIVALVVGLVVASIRSRSVLRRSVPLYLVLVPLAFYAFFSLRAQIDPAQETTINSVTERAQYRDQGLEAWRASPAFGQGMRFFKSGEFALSSDPHNVIVASLSETGVVGLAALLLLLGVAVRTTWALSTAVGVAALTVLVARFTHGLFDIYWVAGTQTLPWMLVGMALADTTAGEDPSIGPATAREPVASPTYA